MKIAQALGLLTIGAVAGMVISVTEYAQAIEFRYHASTCHADSASVPESPSGTGHGMVGTQLYCAIAEYRDVLPHQDIASVDVFGYRTGSSDVQVTSVKACRAFSTTDGGSCGSATSDNSSGNFLLSPSLSAWSSSSGVVYLSITPSSLGAVRGFSIGD
jgi:hypothetical protein